MKRTGGGEGGKEEYEWLQCMEWDHPLHGGVRQARRFASRNGKCDQLASASASRNGASL